MGKQWATFLSIILADLTFTGYVVEKGHSPDSPTSDGLGFVTNATPASQGLGYVKGAFIYMILDDLVVRPSSTISIVTMLHKFNLMDVRALEEKVIDLGLDAISNPISNTYFVSNIGF
ncbi:hypothetical protein DITRI_Ditri09bG0147300 [Diplodiscus trichospermus]